MKFWLINLISSIKSFRGSHVIRKLSWDSDFFGIAMVHLDHEEYGSHRLFEFNRIVVEEKIVFLQSLLPIGDLHKIRELEDAGFRFANIKITFQSNPDTMLNVENGPGSFLVADEDDYSELSQFAPSLFTDSRFYGFADYFPISKIEQLYALWVQKAIHGTMDDQCFKYVVNGETLGFVTVKWMENSAKIGLIGVRPDFHRKGIGKAMLSGLANELTDKSVPLLLVATQGKNISAQNLYIKSGFQVKSVQAWYYRFLNKRND